MVSNFNLYDDPELYDSVCAPDHFFKIAVDYWFKTCLGYDPTSLLDPACGSGWWLAHSQSADVFGGDISEIMVKYALSRLGSRQARIRVSDMTCLMPFRRLNIQAAINIGMSALHLAGPTLIEQHLVAVHDCLVKDGIYIVDFLVANKFTENSRRANSVHVSSGKTDSGRVWTCCHTSCKLEGMLEDPTEMMRVNNWSSKYEITVAHNDKISKINQVYEYYNVYCEWLTEAFAKSGFAIEAALSADILGFPSVDPILADGHIIYICRAI